MYIPRVNVFVGSVPRQYLAGGHLGQNDIGKTCCMLGSRWGLADLGEGKQKKINLQWEWQSYPTLI
jgi:hypothetical protein